MENQHTQGPNMVTTYQVNFIVDGQKRTNSFPCFQEARERMNFLEGRKIEVLGIGAIAALKQAKGL